jgi:hypothetical protein
LAFIVVYDANVLYPNTLRDLLIDRQAVWACVQQIVDSRRQRPVTVEDVLNELARDGLVRSVASLRAGGE